MSPSKFYNSNKNISTTSTNNHGYNWLPPPLKISKNSHSIKKSSPSSSSSSFSKPLAPPPPPPAQHRHPVIIYTHPPKVIHTQPKDFMALVQKLTGLTSGDQESDPKKTKPDHSSDPEKSKTLKAVTEDNESSSVVTEEHGMSSSCSVTNSNNNAMVRDNNNINNNNLMVNSCYTSQPQHHNHHHHRHQNQSNLMNNIPVFGSNSGDFFCPNQSFYSYDDTFLFGGPSNTNTMRPYHVTSSTSTALMEGLNEYLDY